MVATFNCMYRCRYQTSDCSPDPSFHSHSHVYVMCVCDFLYLLLMFKAPYILFFYLGTINSKNSLFLFGRRVSLPSAGQGFYRIYTHSCYKNNRKRFLLRGLCSYLSPRFTILLVSYLHVICTNSLVFASQAIKELNLKTKNWKELLTDEPFRREDIITIQVLYGFYMYPPVST